MHGLKALDLHLTLQVWNKEDADTYISVVAVWEQLLKTQRMKVSIIT